MCRLPAQPFHAYEQTEDLMFPVSFHAAGFRPKERVLGLKLGSETKAYTFVELGKTSGAVADRVSGIPLTIRFDKAALRATAHDAEGRQLPAVIGFWFAWYAFNPATAVFRRDDRRTDG